MRFLSKQNKFYITTKKEKNKERVKPSLIFHYNTYPKTSSMISVISSAVKGTKPKSSSFLSPIILTPARSGSIVKFSYGIAYSPFICI